MRPLLGSRWRVLGLLLAAGLVAAFGAVLALLGDMRDAGALLGNLAWRPLLLLVALGLVDHAIRYVRWELLLRRLSRRGLRRSTNVAIYLLGSLLIFTPARAGEMSKSVYAREMLGIRLEKGLSVLVAERMMDVALMAVLASVGLVLLGRTAGLWQVALIAPGVLGAAALVLFALSRAAAGRTCPGVGGRLARLAAPAEESSRLLFSPGGAGANAGLGVAAWLTEVAMYFTALSALGQPSDARHMAVALAVFPLASLAGAASLMPGGLGATEGSLAALGFVLGGLPAAIAAVAGLLARAAILGVVVACGLLAALAVVTLARPVWTAAGSAGAPRPMSGSPE